MPPSFKSVGYWSLGVVHVAGASLTSFRIEASILSIVIASLTNLICAQCGSSGPGKSCSLGSWLEQLAALCWVSLSCLVFSNYLDFYDDLQHQSYLHLVPIDVFPRVMPLVVVFIICALFALGLEASHFLNIISTALFWATLSVFIFCSLTLTELNFINFTFDEDLLKNTASGISVWFAFTIGHRKENVFGQIRGIMLSLVAYASTLMLLSSLQPYRVGRSLVTSLIEPLGSLHSWYRLIQVPLVSCCLGMALYQLFIPALENVAHRSFVVRLSKDSRLTGTKLAAVTLVGVYCCALIYLYSPGRLILAGSAATLSAKSIDSAYALWTQRWGSQPLVSNKVKLPRYIIAVRKKRNDGYKAVKPAEPDDIETGLLSSDSGHSTDTDIDEIVKEYKVNSEVLQGIAHSGPSTRSGIITTCALLGIITMSFVISFELARNTLMVTPWLCIGQIALYVVISFQPSKATGNTSLNSFLNFISLVLTSTLFGVSVPAVWAPLLLWVTLGVILYLHDDLGNAVSIMSIRERPARHRPNRHFTAKIPAPKIEIKLQAVQLRNKPV